MKINIHCNFEIPDIYTIYSSYLYSLRIQWKSVDMEILFFLYMLIFSLMNTLSAISFETKITNFTEFVACCVRPNPCILLWFLKVRLQFKSSISFFTQYLCNSLVIQTCTWKLTRSSCECIQRKTLKKASDFYGRQKEHSSEYDWELFFIDH